MKLLIRDIGAGLPEIYAHYSLSVFRVRFSWFRLNFETEAVLTVTAVASMVSCNSLLNRVRDSWSDTEFRINFVPEQLRFQYHSHQLEQFVALKTAIIRIGTD